MVRIVKYPYSLLKWCATVEISVHIPQKFRSKTAMYSRYSISGHIAKKLLILLLSYLLIHVYCLCYSKEHHRCPSTNKCKRCDTFTQWNIVKKSEIMKFTSEWMGLETIILNEETQTQKDKHHMFSLICRFESLDNFAFTK